MSLIVHEVALDMIRSVQPLMTSIARHDRNLAVQIRRAASSVALNIAEAEYSDPGTKRSRFHTDAGSAAETRSALRIGRNGDIPHFLGGTRLEMTVWSQEEQPTAPARPK